jgi:large subunit ribosomal protein L29
MGSEAARRNRPDELRKLSSVELSDRLRSARDNLFKLKSDQGTKQLDNPLEIRELRRLVARILTIQTEVAQEEDTGGVRERRRSGKK